MTTPKVYIIILNYNQWKDTLACVESVLQSDYENYSVVAIDNNSPNDSRQNLLAGIGRLASEKKKTFGTIHRQSAESLEDPSTLPDITFLTNDSNAGFAAANNLVLRFLRNTGSYIWLLNPDMIVMENTLSELVKEATLQSKKTVIGAVTRSLENKDQILFYGGGRINFYTATVKMIKSPAQINGLDYISGSSLFTHASNFSQVGLLPENYFLYWEETDWCYQAVKQGIALHVCLTAECEDKISTTIGKNFLADYYYTRNGLRFIRKYRKKNLPVVLFFMSFRFLKRVFSGRLKSAMGVWRGVQDFFKSNVNEYK